MYDELIKRLRECASGECFNCSQYTETTNASICSKELMKQASDAFYEMSMRLHGDEAAISGMKREIERMVVSGNKPRWIPVTERLPETGVDVLVKFPQNMAVASIDIGEWVVNSGDGWCTDINLAGGEKNPTHWMPLPEPPKEES